MSTEVGAELVVQVFIATALPLFFLWFRSEVRGLKDYVRLEIERLRSSLVQNMENRYATSPRVDELSQRVDALQNRVSTIDVRVGKLES